MNKVCYASYPITCWSLSLRRGCEEGLIVVCAVELWGEREGKTGRHCVEHSESLWGRDTLCNLSVCSHVSQCDSQISAENSEEKSGKEVKWGRSWACDAAGTNTDTRCTFDVLMWSWPAFCLFCRCFAGCAVSHAVMTSALGQTLLSNRKDKRHHSWKHFMQHYFTHRCIELVLWAI